MSSSSSRSSSSSSSSSHEIDIKNTPYFCNPHPDKCLQDFKNFLLTVHNDNQERSTIRHIRSTETLTVDGVMRQPSNIIGFFLGYLKNNIGFTGCDFPLVNDIYLQVCNGKFENIEGMPSLDSSPRKKITYWIFKLIGLTDDFFIGDKFSKFNLFLNNIRFGGGRDIFNIQGIPLSKATRDTIHRMDSEFPYIKKESKSNIHKYEAMFDDTRNEIITYNESERPETFNWLKEKSLSHITKNKNDIREIKTLHCSSCWICKKDIFIYQYKLEDDTFKYKSCGEDEHVFPPGIGNLLGTLSNNYDNTKVGLDKGTLVKYGLYASHDFCNKLKSDKCFYKIDQTTGKFSENNDIIIPFVLKWGSTRNTDHGFRNSVIFEQDSINIEEDTNNIKKSILDVITDISNVLNVKQDGTEASDTERRDSIKCKFLFNMTILFFTEFLKKVELDFTVLEYILKTDRNPKNFNRIVNLTMTGGAITVPMTNTDGSITLKNFVDEFQKRLNRVKNILNLRPYRNDKFNINNYNNQDLPVVITKYYMLTFFDDDGKYILSDIYKNNQLDYILSKIYVQPSASTSASFESASSASASSASVKLLVEEESGAASAKSLVEEESGAASAKSLVKEEEFILDESELNLITEIIRFLSSLRRRQIDYIKNYFIYKFTIYYFNRNENTKLDKLFVFKGGANDQVLSGMQRAFNRLKDYILRMPEVLREKGDTLNREIFLLLDKYITNKIKYKYFNIQFQKLLKNLFLPSKVENPEDLFTSSNPQFDVLKYAYTIYRAGMVKDFNELNFKQKFLNIINQRRSELVMMRFIQEENKEAFVARNPSSSPDDQDNDIETQKAEIIDKINQKYSVNAKEVQDRISKLAKFNLITYLVSPDLRQNIINSPIRTLVREKIRSEVDAKANAIEKGKADKKPVVRKLFASKAQKTTKKSSPGSSSPPIGGRKRKTKKQRKLKRKTKKQRKLKRKTKKQRKLKRKTKKL